MDRTASRSHLNIWNLTHLNSNERLSPSCASLAGLSRRAFLSTLAGGASAALLPGLSSALLASLAGCASSTGAPLVPPSALLAEPPLGREPFELLEVAAEYVRLAEASRPADTESSHLWGRVGGSSTEAAAADLLESQLRPWVHGIAQEGFPYEADRPDGWSVAISGGPMLESAVPAPVSARFPDGMRSAPLHAIREDGDWNLATGRWVYLPARPGDTMRRNPARDTETYVRAFKSGAAGLIFSLPTPAGTWRCAIEANPEAPTMQELFDLPLHPIPCFCVDAEDGAMLDEAARGAADLQARIVYEPLSRRAGANVVALLKAGSTQAGGSSFSALGATALNTVRSNGGPIAILANLDAPFSGASDNAGGLATMVGIAQRLALGPELARRRDVYFVGLSAQNDAGAGLRAFAAADPERFRSIDQFYFLRRTEAAAGEGPGATAGGASARIAYLGEKGWDALAEALPEIHAESGVGGEAPQIATRLARIQPASLLPDRARVVALDQFPPYAGTDHDTIDRLSTDGLARAVDFHLRMLEAAGALAPGSYRTAQRTAAAPDSA